MYLNNYGVDPCPEEVHGRHAELWGRTTLIFGLSTPDGDHIDETSWDSFLDHIVTPRFPTGLTVSKAAGQWLGTTGLVREHAHMLMITYPIADARAVSQRIEEIRAAFIAEFRQEAVLREDASPVCVSI